MRRNRSRKGRCQTEDRRYRTEGEIARGSRCARFPGVGERDTPCRSIPERILPVGLLTFSPSVSLLDFLVVYRTRVSTITYRLSRVIFGVYFSSSYLALFPFFSAKMLSLSVPTERASGAIQFLKTRKLTPLTVLGRRFQLTFVR